MEAGSHSGIARLVQQSLGTVALFPSYAFVNIVYTRSCAPFGRLSPLLAVACRRSALLF
jgi:hypothetical protein